MSTAALRSASATDVTTGPELLPALAELPGHLAWRAHSRVGLALQHALPSGVDLHAYAVLLALGGGVTTSQQALSRSVGVSRTTMVKLAAELAARGLVERRRNPADRRSYALTRTPAGATAARSWRRHAEALETSITGGFNAGERAKLRELLLRAVEPELVPELLDALRESVPFLVTRLHVRLHRHLVPALGRLGLEPRHHGALAALQALGPVPQSSLGHHLGLSGASVVHLVDELEQRGLVERRRLGTDRRNQVLHLWPGAVSILEDADAVAADTLDRALQQLDAGQRHRLLVLLRRFVADPAPG